MSKLPKRRYDPKTDRLHADVEYALSQTQSNIDDAALYTPATPSDWASPPPTTIQEALDRLAAVVGSP